MYSTHFVLPFSLLLSLSIFALLANHVFPPLYSSSVPIPLIDEVNDLALFNRASAQSSVSSSSSPSNPTNPSIFSHLSSSKRPKLKIAFLFLTNSDLHFAPIWNRFFHGVPAHLYNIYVHADPSVNLTRPSAGVFHGRFIAAKRTYRGSPTLISATRRLLATALMDDPANYFFVVLSQYCIPLHSFKYIYNSLIVSPTFDLTSTESDTELARLGVRIRYKSFIEIISNAPRLWKRYNARGRFSMLPEVSFEQFRVGSQFFTLTRRHALLVIKDRKLWRKFKLPCYGGECFPEEHYFPTLLSMADPDGCTKYTLTRVNWTGTIKGHPYTYRPTELSSQLIHTLRQSDYSESYLFARKFTPDCLEPLMKLAQSTIFVD